MPKRNKEVCFLIDSALFSRSIQSAVLGKQLSFSLFLFWRWDFGKFYDKSFYEKILIYIIRPRFGKISLMFHILLNEIPLLDHRTIVTSRLHSSDAVFVSKMLVKKKRLSGVNWQSFFSQSGCQPRIEITFCYDI